MRKIYTLLLLLCIAVTGGMAQITVTGCTGTGNGTYTTLGTAITAIGTAQPAANINIAVTGNTTEATASIVIGIGTWSTMTIAPTGGPFTIIAATVAGVPMIDLAGADNVTINGGAGKNLTFTNTTVASTSGTSTFRLINGATNNTITNCVVLGSFFTTTGTNGGNIFFSTDGTTANGNDNNIISNNDIGPVGATQISRGIFGNGSNTTTAINNSGNTISGNNIYDYAYNAASGTSRGIDISTGNTIWTITANKFYFTTTRNLTAAQVTSAIYIVNASTGDGFNINNNVIGNASSAGTGTMTIGSTPATTLFNGIYLSGLSTSTTNSITNNTIANININSTSTGTTAGASAFEGINVPNATAGININGNTISGINWSAIGNSSGTITAIDLVGTHTNTTNINNNNINNITRSNTNSGTMYMIRYGSPAVINANGNNINTISISGVGNTGAIYGIYGLSSALTETINTNTIYGLSSVSSGSVFGIRGFGSSAPKTYSGNTIYNITSAGGGTAYGLYISTGTTVDISTNTIYNIGGTGAAFSNGIRIDGGTTINTNRNNIYNVNAVNAFGISYGINVAGGTTNNITNNFISDIKANTSTLSTAIEGIYVTGGTTNNINNNTINMTAATGGTGFGGAGIYVGSTTPVMNINNNIINIKATASGTSYMAAIKRTSGTTGTKPANLNLANNIYSANNFYGEGLIIGTATNVYGANGIADPFFNDVTGANGATCSPYKQFMLDKDSYSEDNLTSVAAGTFTPVGSSYAESSSLVSAQPTIDFAGVTRSAIADRGALEFVGSLPLICDITTTAGTASAVASTVCQNKPASLLATGYTIGKTGLSYQWASSTTMGGPYADISGATNPTYTTGNLTVPTFYIFKVICGSCGTGTTYTSAEVAIAINAAPLVSVTPTTGSYCTPGGTAVALTGSGAVTYTWSPATGLSATTGTSVNATPTVGTTYTVTGTDANNCTATATTAIAVNATPIISAATATPTTICSGDNSQLLATLPAPTPNKYTVAGSTTTYAAITGTTLGAGAIGDDVGIGNLPIGFNFGYNGATFSVFGARSNGLIELGQVTTALAGFSANALATTANCIAPLWDDNNTTGGTIIYATTGIAPNRVLTVQWTGMHVGNGGLATNPTINMQLQLVETTNEIRFIYGATSAAFVSTTASIGISGAVGNYTSVTPLTAGPPPTVSTSIATENTSVSSATNFPTGTVYTFTPPANPTFAWSPATFLNDATLINPLASAVTTTTTYNVTASANGCTTAPIPVTVTVSSGAAITQQPIAVVKCAGQKAFFKLKAAGPSLTYKWQLNGVDVVNGGTIGGAATDSLYIDVVAAVHGGTYTCIVSSTCGSPVTSDATVTLTVNALPVVTVTPNTGNYCNPGGVAVALTGSGAITYAWSPSATLSAATGTTVNASPNATQIYTVTGTDGNNCTAQATTTITVTQTPSISTLTATPTTICSGGTTQLLADINIPNISVKITEVCLNRGGTGSGVYPAFATGADLIEVTNISGVSVDISGWSLADYASASSTATHTGFVFPSGTMLPPNSVTVVCLGAGTNDAANRYFNTGGANDSWLSSSLVGIVLKNGTTVVDAVGCGSGYVFNAGSGVLASDWAGFAPSASGLAGTTRGAALDNNAGSDWGASSATTLQTIGVYNSGYTAPATTFTYSWSPTTNLNNAAIANPISSGLTATQIYNVTATGNGCTSSARPVTITVNQPPSLVIVNPSPICSPSTADITVAAVQTTNTGTITNYYTTSTLANIGGASDVTTPTMLGAGTYFIRSEFATGCFTVQPVTVTATNPNTTLAGTPGGAQVCQTVTTGTTAYNNCTLVATVAAGTSDLSGNVNNCVTVSNTLINNSGSNGLALARSYSITPTTQPTTGAANVTLYFDQSEFDAYNAVVPGVFPSSPSGSTANVCIYKVDAGGSSYITPASVTYNATTGHWEVTIPVGSFSDFYCVDCSRALAINLSNLRGNITGSTNTLYWNTLTEANNNKFVVQRSSDGVTYSNIGTVATQAISGNSSTALSYNFVDANPVQGKAYYKLQIVNNDNKFTYSPMVTLRRGAGSIEIVDVRPNPTTGTVYFNVIGFSSNISVKVLDMSGKTVAIKANINTTNNGSVDMANLANGTYILQATDAKTGERAIFKIVKN